MKRQRIPTELQDDVKIFCNLKRNQRYTYKYIAGLIGKSNHSTVMHHIESYHNLYETDKAFRAKADAFSEEKFLEDFQDYKNKLANEILNQIQ